MGIVEGKSGAAPTPRAEEGAKGLDEISLS
jgi:hypothetical protein